MVACGPAHFTAPERAGAYHQRNAQCDRGRSDVESDGPRRVTAPGDDSTERDREEKRDQRCEGQPLESSISAGSSPGESRGSSSARTLEST